MRKLDKTVTIGDMTYVREVTEIDFCNCCVYISSLIQFAYFLSLFELVSILTNSMLLRLIFCCYMGFPYALLERGCGCGLHILPTLGKNGD